MEIGNKEEEDRPGRRDRRPRQWIALRNWTWKLREWGKRLVCSLLFVTCGAPRMAVGQQAPLILTELEHTRRHQKSTMK
jgi:hypothetical protein